jgi:tetratricopeptide (TPR) repeat protein
MRPRSESPTIDEIDALRRAGRLQEALALVEDFLKEKPNHSWALLVRSRIFYDLGSMTQAVEGLRDLGRIVDPSRFKSLIGAIERLRDSGKSANAPAFVTESMARLLAQQGYFLESLEVYRRLCEAEPGNDALRNEAERLKSIAEQEGSRDATRERVARELEAYELWLKQHP